MAAWVRVKGWENDDGEFWTRELGYDRFRNQWRIAIRETHGDEGFPDDPSVYTWLFNEAPRKSRISSADKLPELLREPVKEAERTARRLREKTTEVNAFVAALNISRNYPWGVGGTRGTTPSYPRPRLPGRLCVFAKKIGGAARI